MNVTTLLILLGILWVTGILLIVCFIRGACGPDEHETMYDDVPPADIAPSGMDGRQEVKIPRPWLNHQPPEDD